LFLYLYEKFNYGLFQLVAESEQIRREVDNSGPRDELDFWRRKVSRFNYLLDQIKSAHVKAALNVLSVSKSKLLKVDELSVHVLAIFLWKILIFVKNHVCDIVIRH